MENQEQNTSTTIVVSEETAAQENTEAIPAYLEGEELVEQVTETPVLTLAETKVEAPLSINFSGGGITSTISIPAKEMVKFSDIFHRFLLDSGINATLTRSSGN